MAKPGPRPFRGGRRPDQADGEPRDAHAGVQPLGALLHGPRGRYRDQITIEATPGGDGTVAYAEADGTALPDADANTPGHQVDLSTAGKRINVEVTHNDAGEMMEETYGVLVIREGPAVPDTIVLMALYDSTNGEGWTTNTNWGSTEPLSAWYQVSVNADGRVEILGPTTPICGGNNLVGTLPAALGNLDQMEQLSLCGNQLSGTIPASLGNLTSLIVLNLCNNQLSGQSRPHWATSPT